MKIVVFILFNFIFANINYYNNIIPDKILVGTPITITSIINIDTIFTLFPDKVYYNDNTMIIDTIYSSSNTIIQKIKIWDSGIFNVPKIKIKIFNNNKSYIDSFYIDKIEILVDSSSISIDNIIKNKNLKNIKSNIFINIIKYSFFILIGIIFFYLLYNGKIKDKSNKNIFYLSYDEEVALKDLANIINVNVNVYKEVEQYYFIISKIFKKYLASKFFINATKMTTNEIISLLNNKRVSINLVKKIENILIKIDLIKFSKIKLNEIQLLDHKNQVIHLIKEINILD